MKKLLLLLTLAIASTSSAQRSGLVAGDDYWCIPIGKMRDIPSLAVIQRNVLAQETLNQPIVAIAPAPDGRIIGVTTQGRLARSQRFRYEATSIVPGSVWSAAIAAAPAAFSPVPTLSEWAMLALAGVVMILALYRIGA